MTRARRACRLPGHRESADPTRTSRFRLPRLSDADREEIRAARARAVGEPAAAGDAEPEST